jgi:hypothetical protein
MSIEASDVFQLGRQDAKDARQKMGRTRNKGGVRSLGNAYFATLAVLLR